MFCYEKQQNIAIAMTLVAQTVEENDPLSQTQVYEFEPEPPGWRTVSVLQTTHSTCSNM